MPVPGGWRGDSTARRLGTSARLHDGGVNDSAARAHRSLRRTAFLGLALGVACVFLALALPIHITPGNGSLRCADSFFAGGLHYDDSEGLGAACDAAARDRLAHASLLGAGVFVGVGAVAVRRRPWQIAGLLSGGLIASVGLLAVFQNLMG